MMIIDFIMMLEDIIMIVEFSGLNFKDVRFIPAATEENGLLLNGLLEIKPSYRLTMDPSIRRPTIPKLCRSTATWYF